MFKKIFNNIKGLNVNINNEDMNLNINENGLKLNILSEKGKIKQQTRRKRNDSYKRQKDFTKKLPDKSE
jgi:hypothetical protein